MGQLHGKASFVKAAAPFTNASEKDVNRLWESFNDIAEGFGLNQDEMTEICRSLQPTLEIHAKSEMDQLTAALFAALDTDENGLVDALEFLGTLTLMSAMTITQKITFVFNCYDFNESGHISVDELTLALRSTLTGVCKLTNGLLCPTEMVLEDMALHAFHKAQKNGPDDFITLLELLKFAETTPELTSWIDFFDCTCEAVEENDREDSDLEQEFAILHPVADIVAEQKRDPSFPFDAKAPVFSPDNSIPAKPWQTVVSNITPSAPSVLSTAPPAASLDLEWIYGFNSDFRNVVKYTSPTEIIYPAGNVVVLYNVVDHEQHFGFFHSDMVQAIAIHPILGDVVATGERGLVPKVVVWNIKTLEILSVIRGFHQNGISHLAWMPNGKSLVTVGLDPFHCVAVYQWDNNQSGEGVATSVSSSSVDWSRPPILTFAERSDREKVHALLVVRNDLFVTCGCRHLYFWSRESDARYTSKHGVFYKRRGVLGRKAKVQTLVCLTSFSHDTNLVLSGSARGQILLFEGRNCVRAVYGHATTVNVLHTFTGGVLSGGKDGKIRFWSKRLEPGAQFDMEALGSVVSRIRSLVSSPDGGAKILVATAGAEIFEIAASDGSNLHYGPMICGHFAHELHGLAINPLKKEFCSVGDDRTVRIWDLVGHRQLRMTASDSPMRSCAYSPDGASVAVGQGAEETGRNSVDKKLLNLNKQGAFVVLNESNLSVKYEAKDSKKYIRNIKFSADGLTLAVGSSDNFIYVYNAEDWASKGKCKARDATAILSHFDFSSTGEYIRSNAMNRGEMIFFETASGVEITRIATLRDVDWLTCTCPYGWSVQGMWPSVDFRSYEIMCVDRCKASDNGPALLVGGDDLGTIRLFRNPCALPNSQCQVVKGPSSSITTLRFSSDNTCVLSCAKEERCIYQWKVEIEEETANGASPDGVMTGSELEYHATSDDELELALGSERSMVEEALCCGDFALDLMPNPPMPAEAEPLKPWVACAIAPTENVPDEKNALVSSIPSDCLELEWVYGYRCHDVRNNVFISKERGWWLYPAANVVVMFDTSLWLQKHFKQHNDEVTCLAVHFGSKKRPASSQSDDAPTGSTTSTKAKRCNTEEIVASGQMGKYPVIHIWRIETLEVIMSLRGFHRHGIAELRFNHDGTLLASVGLDAACTLGVYDWQNGVLIARATAGGSGRILGLAFQPPVETSEHADDRQKTGQGLLVTVGVKSLTFWRLSGHNLVRKTAILGKKALVQSFLSVVFCGKDAIVGTTSGDLYRLKGIEVVTIVPAHQKCVAALCCVEKNNHLVSGGRDGFVKLWSPELECLAEFGEFNPARHPIRAVYWDFDRNLLLVGTRASSIYQISSLDGSNKIPKAPDNVQPSCIESHFIKELHGLSVCMAKDRFCTTGDDGFLRIWSFARHTLVLSQQLDTASRACAYSFDGNLIAVGLGSSSIGKKHKKDGSLLIFEERNQSVELIYETRDTKQPVSVIRYSPDNQSLVVGAMDNSVYIYDVPNNYAKRAVFNKHKSYITHLDISCDSQYLRSNCGGFELLFADITTGSHVASASALKNQKWQTCHTIFNWFNQGIWPLLPIHVKPDVAGASASSSSTLQVTCSASSLPPTAKDFAKAIIAAGDSKGNLKIFKFPCFVRGAGFRLYRAHSGPIASVEFSASGYNCFSIGSNDRCILQWRKTKPKHPSGEETEVFAPASILKDPEQDPDLITEGQFTPESFVNLPQVQIKPYMSVILPPSNEQKAREQVEAEGVAKTIDIELEHVFGFRTVGIRHNALYCKTKGVVFATGCVGVNYDRRLHQQSFYRNHTRPIVSLATSPDGSFVATGEICSMNLQTERPRIHIWEPSSCTQVKVLSEFHYKAVSYLSFSHDRHLLAALGQDEYHSLSIYRSPTALWFDAALVAFNKTSRDKVFFVCFIEDPASSYHLVTGGDNHVLFWKLDAPNVVAANGIFGSKGQLQPILCGQSMGSNVVTGCLSGHLYLWESCAVTRAIPAHTGAVYCLHATSEGCVSGGKDGHVKVWSRSMTPLSDFDVSQVKPACHHISVRSVYWDIAEDRFLIGTKGGELLELSRLTSEVSLVTEGHYEHDLCALAVHPTKFDVVATAGEDRTVRLWDLTKREVIAKVTLDAPLRAVRFSPDGKLLAVGFGSTDQVSGLRKDGAFMVLDGNALEILHEGRDSKNTISDIKFSPDLTLLAMASHDHNVYLYSTLDNYALRFKFTKASGRITHVDFSADSNYLRLNSDVYELMFVSTLDGTQVTTPSSMKDIEWDTNTCVFTWPTQGLWDPADESTFFHSVARAGSLELLAAGTNKGQIRLYNYPCLSKNSEQMTLRGHGINVSNLVFTKDNSRLVSIGSGDKALFVWKILRKEKT